MVVVKTGKRPQHLEGHRQPAWGLLVESDAPGGKTVLRELIQEVYLDKAKANWVKRAILKAAHDSGLDMHANTRVTNLPLTIVWDTWEDGEDLKLSGNGSS